MFEAVSGDQLSWLTSFVVFCSPARPIPGCYLNLDCSHNLPHYFQFVTNRPTIKCCVTGVATV